MNKRIAGVFISLFRFIPARFQEIITLYKGTNTNVNFVKSEQDIRFVRKQP